jgi:UDP-4-amino-4,6-dideoxy-N-acetyl-beta-L-altrosamine transaminase
MTDRERPPPRHIPYGRQNISDADIAAVVRVLKSDWLTQGPGVPEFENGLATRVGAQHAIAVSSATAALHIGCLGLGLGPGQRLWTSPNTFAASANCARYCGADVDFVDIDPQTLNLSVPALAAKLEGAQRAGNLPHVVVPVHFGGLPCDMAAIGELARKYGFAVIEDASHAVGAQAGSEATGRCTYSNLTVFSFHPVKLLTTGEGGMLLTNDSELAQRLSLLRSHGITRASEKMTGESEGGWYYQQQLLGFNYRMTDIQAALGTSQLGRLDQFLARRRELARRYDELLANLPVGRQMQSPGSLSAYHLYPIRVRASQRGAVFDELRAAGIGVNVHYIPVHLHPYYQSLGFRRGQFPEAERYYDEAITLPLHFGMSDEDQDYIVANLERALSRQAASVRTG